MAYVWHIWYSGHLMLSLYDLVFGHIPETPWYPPECLHAKVGVGYYPKLARLRAKNSSHQVGTVGKWIFSKRTYCSWGGSCCLSLSVTSNAVQQGQAMSSVCNECKSFFSWWLSLSCTEDFDAAWKCFCPLVFKPVVLIDVSSSYTSAFSLFPRPNLAGKCRTPISTIEGTCICPSGPDCEGLAQVVSKCIKGSWHFQIWWWTRVNLILAFAASRSVEPCNPLQA